MKREDPGANSLGFSSDLCVDHVGCSINRRQPLLSARLTSNSLDRIKVVGLRNREQNAVLLERCGIRMNKFVVIQRHGANAPTLFRDLKSAESSPWQSLVPRGAVSASYQVALPVLPRQFSGVTQWTPWTPTMGGSAGVCSDFFERF